MEPRRGRAQIGLATKFNAKHSVDIICGDLNMARWSKQNKNEWHEGTLEELEQRRFLPVSDYVNECCFVAVHERLMQTIHIKGSGRASTKIARFRPRGLPCFIP